MKCVVLDRDGTLIRHVHYLSDLKAVQLLPTVTAGLSKLLKSGCRLFLHTNQSGVGRGYFPLSDVIACNDEMLRQIGRGPELFAETCISPEAPDQEMRYRKPSPRFGLEIIEKYAIEPHELYYIGDNISDLLTAVNIGCMGVGVNTGVHNLRQMLKEQRLEQHFPVFDCFLEVADYVIDYNAQRNGTY